MRAVSRFVILLLAGALAVAPATALAQQTPPSDTPATDSIGPRDLQNFSLNGTVTRAAEQPAPVQPAPQRRQPRATAPATASVNQPSASSANDSAPAPAPVARRTETASNATAPVSRPEPAPSEARPSPAPSVTVPLPAATDSGPATAQAPAAQDFAPEPASTGTLAPDRKFSILPWLLAALALALGGAFLFWRNRQREAFAGGPQIDAFVAPAPAPVSPPRRAPAPPPAAPTPAPPAGVPSGVVSTRIRPWIDIGFQPTRCVLDDERVTIEFELELFNSGSAPARAILIEATMFNAGPTQDQDIGAFFANPVGEGERIVIIPPLKRVALKTQVVAPRAQMQTYSLAGRDVIVPLIAFNALYSWGGGEGQTSVSYLLGRDTNGEKMGPFRLDLGPHIFRGVAARLLPTGVRQ